MAKRGRKPMTAEQKEQKRIEAERNAAADWCSAMPKDEDARKEPFIDLVAAKDDLKDQVKELKNKLRVSTFEGTLKNHGWEPQVVKFYEMMSGKSQAMQTRIWRQMMQLAEDSGWNAQNDLFEAGSMGETRGDSPVFDKTGAGAATSGMGGAAPAKSETEQPQVDTGRLEPDEAVVKFEEAAAKAKARRGKKADAPAPVAETDPDDPRPRHLRQADADRKAEGEGKPSEPEKPTPKKATGARKRPASPAAQAAQDLGIGAGGTPDQDDADDRPGNFRVQG